MTQAHPGIARGIGRLRNLLDEPRQTVEAIRSGTVDAFVVGNEGQERVLVLSESDPPYRLIVEEMAQGAVTLTREGVITYCNPEFAKLVGFDRQEILGRSVLEFVPEAGRETLAALVADSSDQRCELALRAKDGTAVPVMIGRRLLHADAGAHSCLVIADLREQQAHEELRTAKETAEQANTMKDEFLAMASHELRTPLTAILGWTQYVLMLSNLEGETARDAMKSIQQSAKGLTKLVDDILDSSRLASGKLSLQKEVTDLGGIARLVTDWLIVDARSHEVSLNLEVPADRVPVNVDPERIQQVIANLLTNAIRFSTAGGMVNIRLEKESSVARLVVIDHGDGIDSSFLPHVFEAFRQGEARRSHRGLGLGLSIVRQLVEAHGGSVTAASEGRGKGATFVVELPLAD